MRLCYGKFRFQFQFLPGQLLKSFLKIVKKVEKSDPKLEDGRAIFSVFSEQKSTEISLRVNLKKHVLSVLYGKHVF